MSHCKDFSLVVKHFLGLRNTVLSQENIREFSQNNENFLAEKTLSSFLKGNLLKYRHLSRNRNNFLRIRKTSFRRKYFSFQEMFFYFEATLSNGDKFLCRRRR